MSGEGKFRLQGSGDRQVDSSYPQRLQVVYDDLDKRSLNITERRTSYVDGDTYQNDEDGSPNGHVFQETFMDAFAEEFVGSDSYTNRDRYRRQNREQVIRAGLFYNQNRAFEAAKADAILVALTTSRQAAQVVDWHSATHVLDRFRQTLAGGLRKNLYSEEDKRPVKNLVDFLTTGDPDEGIDVSWVQDEEALEYAAYVNAVRKEISIAQQEIESDRHTAHLENVRSQHDISVAEVGKVVRAENDMNLTEAKNVTREELTDLTGGAMKGLEYLKGVVGFTERQIVPGKSFNRDPRIAGSEIFGQQLRQRGVIAKQLRPEVLTSFVQTAELLEGVSAELRYNPTGVAAVIGEIEKANNSELDYPEVLNKVADKVAALLEFDAVIQALQADGELDLEVYTKSKTHDTHSSLWQAKNGIIDALVGSRVRQYESCPEIARVISASEGLAISVIVAKLRDHGVDVDSIPLVTT